MGPEEPPLVVAELGINHGGSLDVAIELARLALDSGAEVIKHQTHIPDEEMSLEAKTVIPGNAKKSIYDVISENSLSLEDEVILANYVRGQGGIYLSTPFSREAAKFLNDEIHVPAFKIGSGECNNYPLVEYIASLGKPIIMSTGMNTIATIAPSVEIFRKHSVPFALLHCTNLYPTPEKLIRIEAILDLKQHFPDAVVGLSDHSISNYPCLGAVSLGASILERHFTDSKSRLGPDIVCSMTPSELSELIAGSRIIHSTMGREKKPNEEEGVTIAFAFASVVSTKEINPGEILSRDNIWLKRPNGGDFSPLDFENLLGRMVVKRIEENTQIKRDQLAT